MTFVYDLRNLHTLRLMATARRSRWAPGLSAQEEPYDPLDRDRHSLGHMPVLSPKLRAGRVSMPRRIEDVARFYRALRRLEEGVGGARRLSQCDGRTGWPERGVYFFFQNGEVRADSGDGPRVVRVGTHALISGSGASLWGRLRGHRGDAETGGGNHRGSIFRLLIGAALAARDPHVGIDTWGRGSSAPRAVRDREATLERLVSNEIGEMPMLWLRVDDPPGPDSMRGYVERNAIALLGNHDRGIVDPPSEGWLGRNCPRERVHRSGLWNQRHVDEEYDPEFLPKFEEMVGDP